MCPVPKICFASDSKAALGMLNVLRLPSGRLDHLTPKGSALRLGLKIVLRLYIGPLLDCLFRAKVLLLATVFVTSLFDLLVNFGK